MNRYSVFIRIAGKAFDARSFEKALPPELRGGVVRKIKKVGAIPGEHEEFIWKSSEVEFFNSFNFKMAVDVIRNNSSAIKSSTLFHGNEKYLVIIAYYNSASSVSGIYIPKELLQISLDFDLSIDIDQYVKP